MNVEAVQLLWNYNFWADDRFDQALESFSAEEFLKDLGDGCGSVKDKLAHIHGAEDVWLKRVQGEKAPQFRPATEFTSVESLKSFATDIRNGYKSLLSTLTDSKLTETVNYLNLKGLEFTTPLSEILLHVANHGTYHRGQAASLIRRIKGKPPITDLIEYFRATKTP